MLLGLGKMQCPDKCKQMQLVQVTMTAISKQEESNIQILIIVTLLARQVIDFDCCNASIVGFSVLLSNRNWKSLNSIYSRVRDLSSLQDYIPFNR